MASQPGAAAAWDAEYAAGRYSCEPPVAFTGDILAAVRQAGLTRGLYIGCGNGRNYLPLVAGGLDLTGAELSELFAVGFTPSCRHGCGRPAVTRPSPVSGPSGKRSGARPPRSNRAEHPGSAAHPDVVPTGP